MNHLIRLIEQYDSVSDEKEVILNQKNGYGCGDHDDEGGGCGGGNGNTCGGGVGRGLHNGLDNGGGFGFGEYFGEDRASGGGRDGSLIQLYGWGVFSRNHRWRD